MAIGNNGNYERSPGQGVYITTSSVDTFPYTCILINQNVQGISDEENMDKIVDTMVAKGINIYCIQETWKLGKYTTTIQEQIICHNGIK